MCAVMALSFTACGNKDDSSSSVNGLGEWTRMTENSDDVSVTIVNAGIGKEWINNMAQAYEDDTGVKVKVSFADDSAIISHFATDRSSVYSDLYLTYATFNWTKWAATGKLYNLDELCSFDYSDGTDINDNMYEIFDNYGKFNDSRYILQYTYSPTGFVYNVDYLKQLGYDSFPETWDGLLKLCSDILNSNLKAGDRKVMPLSFGGSVDDLNNAYITLWAQQNPEAYQAFFNYDSADGAPAAMYGEERKVAMEAIYDLLAPSGNYSTTTIEGAASDDNVSSETWFLLGYTAFCPTGAWFESEVASILKDSDVNYAFAAVPALKKADGSGYYDRVLSINVPTEYFAIPAKSGNPEGAADFLRYICHKENLKKVHELTGMPLAFEYETDGLNLNAWQKSVTDALEQYKNVYAFGYSNYYAVGALRTGWYKSTNPILQILNNKLAKEDIVDKALMEEYNVRNESWGEFTSTIGSLGKK